MVLWRRKMPFYCSGINIQIKSSESLVGCIDEWFVWGISMVQKLGWWIRWTLIVELIIILYSKVGYEGLLRQPNSL